LKDYISIIPMEVVLPNFIKVPLNLPINDLNIIRFYSHTKTNQYLSAEALKYWKFKGYSDTIIYSNLYPCKINIPKTEEHFKGRVMFDSTEHYFQMYKYGEGDRNFMEHLSSNDVASFGQRRLKFQAKHTDIIKKLQSEGKEIPLLKNHTYKVGDTADPQLIRDNWQNECLLVMLIALRAKFSQHPDLQQSLKATEGAWLVEHTKNDSKWADGETGKGTNYLGKLLVQVRQEIIDGKEYDMDLTFLKTPMEEFLKYNPSNV